MSPRIILNSLRKALQYLPLEFHFPYAISEQNIGKMLSLSEIKLFRADKKLIFIIRQPLTSDVVYDFFNLLPLPTKLINDKYIYIQPRGKFLLLEEDKSSYALLENMNGCKMVQTEFFICSVPEPFYLKEGEEICEVGLLMRVKDIPSDCDTRLIILKREVWKKIHFFNTWLYVSPIPTKLTIKCNDILNEETVFKTGILTLNEGCKAYTHDIKLHPSEIGFNEKFSSIIPTVNVTEIVQSIMPEIEDFMDKFPTKIPNDYESLESLGISITNISRKVSSYTWLYHFLIYLLIAVIILSVLIFSTYKLSKSKRNVQSSSNIESTDPVQNMKNLNITVHN